MCGAVWMHLFLHPGLFAPAGLHSDKDTMSPAVDKRKHELSCGPAVPSAAPLHLSPWRIPRTSLNGQLFAASQPFPRRVFSAAPVVCHLSIGVDWPIQVARCSLPLTFSATADFLALTCLSLLNLDWTGQVQRFLGQRSEGSKKNQGRSTWEQFKRCFVLWQFSSFVWLFGALTSGCWASWAHVPLPMVLESRAQSCVENTWWSKPL